MTHWREPHRWKRGLDMFEEFQDDIFVKKPERKPINDWAVFWVTVGCALLVAAVGWWTA